MKTDEFGIPNDGRIYCECRAGRFSGTSLWFMPLLQRLPWIGTQLCGACYRPHVGYFRGQYRNCRSCLGRFSAPRNVHICATCWRAGELDGWPAGPYPGFRYATWLRFRWDEYVDDVLKQVPKPLDISFEMWFNSKYPNAVPNKMEGR